jgi:hypothetical protein
MELATIKEKVSKINENFSIQLYDTYVPEPLLSEINTIIKESDLKEPFDYIHSKYFIIAKCGSEIIGLVVYGEIKIDGVTLPRFLHIIIVPKYKRTKLAYRMLMESEQEIKKLGFKLLICFIRFDLPEREIKIKYAIKDGYLKYSKNEAGEFYYKMIK